jgi:pre-mRNA-processing factor 19
VTPSGYICERRFLLSKLIDTNGLDPLVDNGRELKESDLISIQRPLVTAPPPRLPSVTSFSNLLEMMQQEHDALLLELYDTHKALEETRVELSQALYQNDAAVRVVARLSLERDEARRLLSQWNADPSSRRPIPSDDDPHLRNLSNLLPAVVAEEDHPMEEVVGETQPLVTTAPPSIPQEDLQNLIAAWKELSDQRRQSQKKRKHELSTEHPLQIHENSKAEVKSVHKTNKPGIVALSTIRHPTTQSEYVLSAGIDKTLVIYNQTTQNIVQTLMNSNGKHFTALDVVSTSSSLLIAAVDTSGMLQVFKEVSKQEDHALSTYELFDAGLHIVTEQDAGGDAEVVAVSFHPFGRYLLVSLTTGKVVIVKVMENHLQILTSFQTQQADSGTTSITCSALHPDGLIFSVGKSDGSIEIWDLKTLSLASTLETPSGVEKTPVTSLAFSENGTLLSPSHLFLFFEILLPMYFSFSLPRYSHLLFYNRLSLCIVVRVWRSHGVGFT